MEPHAIYRQYFEQENGSLFLLAFVSLIGLICFPVLLFQHDPGGRFFGVMLLLLLLWFLSRKIPEVGFRRRVKQELESNHRCERTAVFSRVEDAHPYYRLGVSPIPTCRPRQLVLYDTEGNQYRFAGRDSYAQNFVGRKLKLTYLPQTGFLLSVELTDEEANPYLTQSFEASFPGYVVPKE